MSRYQTTTGFVIGRQDLREADRILRLFTRELGRIDVIAKGIRKPQAKLAGRVEPFFEVEWRLALGRGLPTVIGAELHSSSRPDSLASLGFGWGLLELTDHSFRSEEQSTDWYSFLQASLQLEDDQYQPIVWLAGLAKSLHQLGLHPDLPTGQAGLTFRLSDGELIEGGGGVGLSPEFIKLWRVAREWPLQKLIRITNAAPIATSGLSTLEQFWTHHSGHRLTSRTL